ncbi:dipicolinate synthase subunit B [Ferroacidibacillus organovorans]|uniref:Dipicolinate synthase subunit B n=1 Tax=Ferroacidibacillus organovorans TaxID=1765683 RepID=A0A101XT28_9BACL|nr:dipicolinate synthase subunit B [Ferroacidibacillus organovorans]KUO97028.1 dipicolinate synthase subunit B [Ferroacidibacillus organovorans]
MELRGKTIGFAITGSHCTYEEVFPEIERFINAGVSVVPIFSQTVINTGTRFGEAGVWAKRIEELTGETGISTIPQAEPLGPSKRLDALVIAPCTGSTLSRFANAQTDSAVLMAAKSTLRNDRPVVLAISTNDGLGLNALNIARLMTTKNIFFVPYGQDDPVRKINSLVAQMNLLQETVEAALEKKQLQPVLIERFRAPR